jgi:hypothetical protein
MNNELKNFIESELELNGLPFCEKYSKVQEKIVELKNVTGELESYLIDEMSTILRPIKEIGSIIKMKFPEMEEERYNHCYDLYVPFEISGMKFTCCLSRIFNTSKYQSGIYSFEKRKTGITEIATVLDSLLKKEIIEDHKDDWYGYKIISDQDEALAHFTNLINTVKAEKEKLG